MNPPKFHSFMQSRGKTKCFPIASLPGRGGSFVKSDNGGYFPIGRPKCWSLGQKKCFSVFEQVSPPSASTLYHLPWGSLTYDVCTERVRKWLTLADFWHINIYAQLRFCFRLDILLTVRFSKTCCGGSWASRKAFALARRSGPPVIRILLIMPCKHDHCR